MTPLYFFLYQQQNCIGLQAPFGSDQIGRWHFRHETVYRDRRRKMFKEQTYVIYIIPNGIEFEIRRILCVFPTKTRASNYLKLMQFYGINR